MMILSVCFLFRLSFTSGRSRSASLCRLWFLISCSLRLLRWLVPFTTNITLWYHALLCRSGKLSLVCSWVNHRIECSEIVISTSHISHPILLLLLHHLNHQSLLLKSSLALKVGNGIQAGSWNFRELIGIGHWYPSSNSRIILGTRVQLRIEL